MFKRDNISSKAPKLAARPLVYKGGWANDMLNGDGILKFSNGLILAGQFHDNCLKDTLMQAKYKNGDIYGGSHKGGVKQGKGTYIFKEGNVVFRGDWKDNKKEGTGEMIFTEDNNATLIGTWTDDDLCTGEYTDSAGNLFRNKKHPEKRQ